MYVWAYMCYNHVFVKKGLAFMLLKTVIFYIKNISNSLCVLLDWHGGPFFIRGVNSFSFLVHFLLYFYSILFCIWYIFHVQWTVHFPKMTPTLWIRLWSINYKFFALVTTRCKVPFNLFVSLCCIFHNTCVFYFKKENRIQWNAWIYESWREHFKF